LRFGRIRLAEEKVDWKGSFPFLLVHLLPLFAFVTGVTTKAVVLGVSLYFLRMFAITAGYHRYFAHKTYRLGRVPQFLLAFLGETAAQKGVLWWASRHRDHHKYADTARDPHSPQKGFWWAHIGWIMSGRYSHTEYENIQDFAQYKELVWLNEHDWLPPWLLGVFCFVVGGWSGLVVGFFASTVLLWHMTFTVNSVAHVWGSRRYGTADTARNNLAVAVLTMGEGWHNNHHHYPASTRQGFFWWEVDTTYYLLRLGKAVGLVRDMKEPPVSAKAARRVRSGHFDIGRFKLHLRRAGATVPEGNPAVEELLDLLADTERRAATVVMESRVKASAGATSAD
jgi:stearoyl-CoA desaturase (delta-9 desaturase)